MTLTNHLAKLSGRTFCGRTPGHTQLVTVTNPGQATCKACLRKVPPTISYATDFLPGQAVWTGNEALSSDLNFRTGEIVRMYIGGKLPEYLVRWTDGTEVILHERFLLAEPPVRCGDLDCVGREHKLPGFYWVAGYERCQACQDDLATRSLADLRMTEEERSRGRYLLSDHTAGFHSEPRPGCAGCDNAKLATPVTEPNPHAPWCAGGEPGWSCDCLVSTAQKLAAAVDWHRVYTERGDATAAQGELDAMRRYAAEILANTPGASCDRCGSDVGPFRETAHAETICVDVQACGERQATDALDKLTRAETTFGTFAELVAAPYTPTLASITLADAYDAATGRKAFRRPTYRCQECGGNTTHWPTVTVGRCTPSGHYLSTDRQP